MKSFVPWFLVLTLGLGWSFDRSTSPPQDPATGTNMDFQQFEIGALEKKRAESKRSYLEFLNVSTMNCGLYFLAAGAKDGQSPHVQDEAYYVLSGRGKFTVDGEEAEVRPGSFLFVAAGAEHRFHSITEDLSLLVFFSAAKPAEKGSSDE